MDYSMEWVEQHDNCIMCRIGSESNVYLYFYGSSWVMSCPRYALRFIDLGLSDLEHAKTEALIRVKNKALEVVAENTKVIDLIDNLLSQE